ncbi:hypothetical protein U9M48_000182 [Paspalum notatum var. saurae]|uniref:Uncharacterized protein n=1 Tax=Paspalum notatum var. saurae TaxID=547442 RepID=A0AAQ3PGH7_PASNO
MADEEPFSPSVFLDLPPSPTPHSIDVGGGDDLASSDDMVVLPPFISRMLMDMDSRNDDDILYRPDHPALPQAAEQPLAQMLSSFSSHATTGSSSATSNTTTTLVSPASSSTRFADATWPYDPDELSQMLLSPQSTVGEEEASALFNGRSSCCIGHQFHGGDGAAEEQGRVTTMDMFLKGMEEGSKFLPTTRNNAERVFVSSSKQQGVFQEGSDDGDGRTSRKSRHDDDSWCWDDDDEASGRRSAKLMALEPEGSGEVSNCVILKGYEVAVEKMMHGLSISMLPGAAGAGGGGGGEEDEKANKSHGKGKGSRRQQRTTRRGGNEAVDLRTLLLYCAEAVSAGNSLRATELLRQIKQRSSPTGDASQRLAHCFAQGLELRLAGSGTGVAKPKHTLAAGADFFKAYLLYSQVCCFRLVAFKFSHMAIVKAVAGRKKVHVVDYGVHLGFHWLLLLGAWAASEGGPPEVRITGIDFPQPGFRPAARIKETGRRLSDFARRHGVPFKFRSVVATKWETVSAEHLDIQPDEALVVNGMFHFERHFGKLMDEGVVIDINSPSPRDMVLVNIRNMQPDVFILCVENSSYNTPFFVTRFREALFYYSAMFDMMDATAPRDCAERVVVEREFLGRCVVNAIACEGSARVERPETYKQWQVRCSRAGLRQLPLNPGTVQCLRNRVKEGYHRNFVIDVDQQWLLEGWNGRILYAMSTWAADV